MGRDTALEVVCHVLVMITGVDEVVKALKTGSVESLLKKSVAFSRRDIGGH